jgi:ABC-type amino acid transport system permease subunit
LILPARTRSAGYYSVGEALWLNIRMCVAAEILILILALVVAIIRQSAGPALLPLRVISTVYVDVARGVPLILIIFAIGFGIPAPLLNDFISLQKDTALVGLLGAIEANKAAKLFSDTVFNYSSYVVAAILVLILTIPLARFTGLSRAEAAARAAVLLDRFGLGEKRADYPDRLSGGQQRGSRSSGRWPCGRDSCCSMR